MGMGDNWAQRLVGFRRVARTILGGLPSPMQYIHDDDEQIEVFRARFARSLGVL